jgi:hypothetical protein
VSPDPDPSERIRTLLLRGDNLLKSSSNPDRLGRALEAFEEADQLCGGEGVDPRMRDLVTRRIASVRQLIGE